MHDIVWVRGKTETVGLERKLFHLFFLLYSNFDENFSLNSLVFYTAMLFDAQFFRNVNDSDEIDD